VAGRDAALVRPTIAFAALEPPDVQAWRLVPLTDGAGNRLAGLLAGAADADGRPVLRVLRAEGPAIMTPLAAALRIAATPAVMAATASPGNEASSHRGRLFAVPAGGTLVYAQALYAPNLQPSQPLHLTAVAVLAGARVGIGPDVRSAVGAMMRGGGDGMAPAGVQEMAQAQAAFLALDSARQSGDWERFGRAWTELRRALHLESAPAPRRP
jgi:hypothetical protein